MLEKDHPGNHKVLDNCHSLAAFGGCRISTTNHPYLSVCHSREAMINPWLGYTRTFNNCKQLIDE
jgi:hypothetical protein